MEPASALAKVAAARPPRWQWRGADCVHSLQWAPHGHTLAAATLAGELVSLSAADGKVRWHVADAHPGGALWCVFHPTEPLLASGGQDGAVKLWQADTGQLVRVVVHEPKRWSELGAWSADGEFLATAAGKAVSFWNAAGEAKGRTADQKATVAVLAWHPRDAALLVAAYGGLSVWTPGAAKPDAFLERATPVLAAAWRPGGEWAAFGTGDASMEAWRVGTEETLRMAGYPTKIRELAWHGTGDHLSTGGGTNVVCWDFRGDGPAGSTPIEFLGHSEFITALAPHPTDPRRVASTGRDHLVFVWQTGADDPVAMRAVPDSVPLHVAWQPRAAKEPLLAVGCEGGEIVLFKVAG